MYRITLGVSMLAVTALIGCGGPSGEKTYPVSGKVSVNGQPVTSSVLLSFTPKNESGENVSGMVVNGSYEGLTTYKPNDGIPEGEYDVTIEADPSMPTPIPEVTPQTVTVTPETTTLDIDFKGTGKMRSPLAIPGQMPPGAGPPGPGGS